MTTMKSMTKGLRACLLGSAAVALMGSAALAADLGAEGGLKGGGAAKSDWTIKANGSATTDYTSRGISNSDNDPSVSVGIEAAYKMFYVGVQGFSVDEAISAGAVELDLMGGVRRTYRGIDLDFGFIYYLYPSHDHDQKPEYLELKAAASTKILNDLTIGGTVWWSPDAASRVGSTWTFEGTASKPLPINGLSLVGALGYVSSEDKNGAFSAAYGATNYTYWNAGLAYTFREHYAFDVRYWGTNVSVPDAIPDARHLNALADDRVVGTFTFNY
jgi:uncharacterized protein (TIGR02001 family)